MNYYEQIQIAIDYIENNLNKRIDLEYLAKISFFSIAQFYRMFFSLTAYRVKEYIRKRRMHKSGSELLNSNKTILEIAIDYQYESHEAFTRAFQNEFSVSPTEFRKNKVDFEYFNKIDLIKEYFLDENSPNPKIKVIKVMKNFKVASFTERSESPELEAWKKLFTWAEKEGVLETENYRLFGFDLPDKSDDSKLYSYEVWISLPDNFTPKDNSTIIKNYNGGLYAITSSSLDSIGRAWDNLGRWLKISSYEYGDAQWLEEHVAPLDKWNDKMKINIMIPIKKRHQ